MFYYMNRFFVRTKKSFVQKKIISGPPRPAAAGGTSEMSTFCIRVQRFPPFLIKKGSFWAAGQLANRRLSHPAWPASRALQNDHNLHTCTRFPPFQTKK